MLTVPPSFALTVMPGYVPGMVAGVSVSVAVPVFVVSATEVAMMLTLAGRLADTVGAVYVVGLLVAELSEPQGFGLPLLSVVLLKAQFTPPLLALVTVAISCAV